MARRALGFIFQPFDSWRDIGLITEVQEPDVGPPPPTTPLTKGEINPTIKMVVVVVIVVGAKWRPWHTHTHKKNWQDPEE